MCNAGFSLSQPGMAAPPPADGGAGQACARNGSVLGAMTGLLCRRNYGPDEELW